ncbi:uncharacterized protein OCT59_020870 [Rhizophagus irregularis]|uniref:Methyltransferase domain-containing protein n=4 Tax=Rhizophagus irregularis TaxID=588596 RepID=A0A915ZKW2_9GLOM|nr:hypothetical protein RirG_229040 [Rhizophagus irregularis DAOM 197198w]UZO02389.1 hypothetical protein OCT59_020870 [Rhizophagus irregularis]CAB5378420.1 unnamed protein product [Rhizophagus irregularis]
MGIKYSSQKLKFKLPKLSNNNYDNNNNNKQKSNSMIMNKEEEIILINDDDKDLKFYFNSENNVHRQHNHTFLKKYLFKCNISSPVNENLISGGMVLDIGCGPSTFLLEVAGQYPNSKFFGIDIEPVFPQEIKPSNLEFKLADMFQGLPFPDNTFDLVHLETILFSITPAQLDFIINEMVRVTKPSGYIEFVETHMTCRNKGVGENFGLLLSGFELVANSYGADPDLVLTLPQLLIKNPNIEDPNVIFKELVLGRNGGKLGVIIQDVFNWFNNSSESFVNDACKQLKITKEQYFQLVKDAFKEIDSTFPETDFIRIYAQKK